MAYIDTFNASRDPDFQGRCKVAVWIAAEAIAAEDPQTPNYEARQAWARTAQQDRLAIAPENLAQAVLRNTTIAANPAAASDGDIQFQVNSIIDWLIAQG
jgi:hypothetical protein